MFIKTNNLQNLINTVSDMRQEDVNSTILYNGKVSGLMEALSKITEAQWTQMKSNKNKRIH